MRPDCVPVTCLSLHFLPRLWSWLIRSGCGDIMCNYFLGFHRLSFCFLNSFCWCTEVFNVREISFIYFSLEEVALIPQHQPSASRVYCALS